MTIYTNKHFDDHEQVVFCNDKNSGLKAIIAIHDTRLGPSLGGCRMYPYDSHEEALGDVLRLSRGMTYKSAITGLNFGGGKSVIIADPAKHRSEALFRTFGRFVNGLSGRYITAEDVGTNLECMEWIRIETKHVVGTPSYLQGSGDPSPVTAHGTFIGIKSSLKRLYGNDDLTNCSVAVQGVGHVGYYLCKELYEHGAKIYATDVNKDALQRVANEFNVQVVEPDKIHGLDVDVFAPCALGATINDKTIPQLKCKIVAGAANNQLADEEKHANELQRLGILYAPDYLINAGGLASVATEFFGVSNNIAYSKVDKIYDTLLSVFDISEQKNISPLFAANRLARKRIEEISKTRNIFTKHAKNRRG